MSDDLVRRLRNQPLETALSYCQHRAVLEEAADRIEQLEREKKQQNELVERMARVIDPYAWNDKNWGDYDTTLEAMHMRREKACDRARAALKAHEEWLAEQGLEIVYTEGSVGTRILHEIPDAALAEE